jgi:hypothetical protein
MKNDSRERWYRAEKQDAPALLIAECEKAIKDNSSRRAEALLFCSLFEGMNVTSFGESGYICDNDEVFRDLDIPIVRNTCRSIVQTAVSKITAQDSPLPQFMSTGGDWAMRTKAVRLDRLVTAEYGRPQGCFSNLHELFRHGASLAMAATGSFAVFFCATNDGLTAELDDTLTLGVERSGRYGRIISLVRTTWYSAEDLIERFPDDEEKILEAEECNDSRTLGPTDEVTPERGVRVHQGWRTARGETAGRYMCVLKDGTVLVDDDEFERDTPPVAMWHYERTLYGQWGSSMTRGIYNQVMRVNQIIADVDYAERNSPQGLVLHKKDATRAGDLEKVRGWQFVEINGAGDMSQAFNVVTPPKFSQDSLGLLRFHEEGAHDISGVSNQHTSAKRATGTTSGKHENMVAALFTERFADAERRLIDMRTTVSARFIVWTLQDVLEQNPDYSARYVKGDYIEEIKLADLELDEDQYCLTIAPVSEDKNTPKARLDKMDQAFEAGLLTGSELLAFQQDFDDKQRTSLAIAQEEWLERQVDAWQHSDAVEYQGPIPWMDLQSAAKTVAQHLLVARSKGLPDDRLLYFTRFLDEVQAYISQTSVQASAAGAIGPGGGGLSQGAQSALATAQAMPMSAPPMA